MSSLRVWFDFRLAQNRRFGWFWHPIIGRRSHGGWFYFNPFHPWATIVWWYRFGLHEEDALAGRCIGIGKTKGQ